MRTGMTDSAREDYEKLRDFWDRAFGPAEEARAGEGGEAPREDDWRGFAPSEKLFAAARSMAGCRRALDYGCGDGWAGVIAAGAGCPDVTCADVAPNAVAAAEACARRFRVAERVHPICVSESWLSQVPDGACDGFFCSNVLDVVPPEMAEDILNNAARIVGEGGRAVIGLNYCMPPGMAEERGLECRDGNRIYVDGVLRLVSRTDEEWEALFDRYFCVERLEHFAWPGEKAETRRLFYLKSRGRQTTCLTLNI